MQQLTEKQNQQQANEKKKKRILWLLLLLLLLTAGYFGYDYFFNKEEIPATVTAGDFLPAGKDAGKMTDKEIAAYAQKTVDESQFNMKIVSNATIDKETMMGNLAIQNPPANTQPVNVVVTLDTSGEVIYTSGGIQPGEEITEATLEKQLAARTHTATATFNIYNPETKKKQGQVQSVLTLMVQ